MTTSIPRGREYSIRVNIERPHPRAQSLTLLIAIFDRTLSGMVLVKMIIFHIVFRLLLEGCPLIAIHKVRYYKRGDGLALGPGPFVTALEFASDVQAEVVGKPQPSFFQQALKEIGCDTQSAVMIGDVSQA